MEEEIKTKVCTKCGVEKPLTEFYRDKSKKDGRRNICKSCDKEKDKLDKLNPPIKKDYTCEDGMKICRKCLIKKPVSEFNKDKNSPDELYFRCKSCIRDCYSENRSNILEYKKEYYIEHKDDKQQYDKNYRQKNKKKLNVEKKIYYSNNKDRLSEKSREYRLEHKTERQEYFKKYNKTPAGRARISRSFHKRRHFGKLVENTLTDKQWDIILYDQQHNLCAECEKEFNEERKPTKDHILPLSSPWRKGLTFGNTRALCQSCNSKKHDHMYFMRGVYELLVTNI
jgi:hypothetical protein